MTKELCALSLLVMLSGCAESAGAKRHASPARKPDVAPIRNTHLVVFINMDIPGRVVDDFNNDVTAATVRECLAIAERTLTELGKPDGNTFERVFRQDAPGVNFRFYFSADYNNSQARWNGTTKLDGWGWGDIAVLKNEGQRSPQAAVQELARQDYQFLHDGWHAK